MCAKKNIFWQHLSNILTNGQNVILKFWGYSIKKSVTEISFSLAFQKYKLAKIDETAFFHHVKYAQIAPAKSFFW